MSLDEVAKIYLPMSRLLNLYVGGTQDLYRASATFLGGLAPKVPYIIGIGGSVAVGKSTTGRILRELLARWPNHPQVDLVTTDGFLHRNAILEERRLMERKGFPESFDIRTLVNFVLQVKSGERRVEHPVYSHHSYDILPGATEIVDQPDILILEGLNVLQARSEAPKSSRLMLSDLFDFSIYVDAETDVVERWYVERFLTSGAPRSRIRRLLPPLRQPERRGRHRHGARHLEDDQRAEPDPEHPADPRASRSDPREGARPRGAPGAPAQAVAKLAATARLPVSASAGLQPRPAARSSRPTGGRTAP